MRRVTPRRVTSSVPHLRRLTTASSAPRQRTVARIDGNPVLINNLASFYYNARPLEDPGGSRNAGQIADLTGFRVWESGPRLISYIDRHRSTLIQNRTVLELGAGMGAVGLAAAALYAKHVVLSDADSVATLAGEHGWEERGRLATLADNAKLNGERAAAVSVEALSWGDPVHLCDLSARWPDGFETILASDCLYSPRNYDALEATILSLAAADAVVVLSYPVRHGEEHTFIERLLPAFECSSSLAEEEASGSDTEKALRVTELRRRAS